MATAPAAGFDARITGKAASHRPDRGDSWEPVLKDAVGADGVGSGGVAAAVQISKFNVSENTSDVGATMVALSLTHMNVRFGIVVVYFLATVSSAADAQQKCASTGAISGGMSAIWVAQEEGCSRNMASMSSFISRRLPGRYNRCFPARFTTPPPMH
jgi:hypothetical protein